MMRTATSLVAFVITIVLFLSGCDSKRRTHLFIYSNIEDPEDSSKEKGVMVIKKRTSKDAYTIHQKTNPYIFKRRILKI